MLRMQFHKSESERDYTGWCWMCLLHSVGRGNGTGVLPWFPVESQVPRLARGRMSRVSSIMAPRVRRRETPSNTEDQRRLEHAGPTWHNLAEGIPSGVRSSFPKQKPEKERHR